MSELYAVFENRLKMLACFDRICSMLASFCCEFHSNDHYVHELEVLIYDEISFSLKKSFVAQTSIDESLSDSIH